MSTFYDALSGEKRKLNIRTTAHTETGPRPWCEGGCYGHSWPNSKEDDNDETVCCERCGVSLLRVRAMRNLRTGKLWKN